MQNTNKRSRTAIVPAAAVLAAVIGLLGGCKNLVSSDKIAVTGVTLNKTTIILTVGGTETLIATVQPEKAKNKTVTWTSNNAAAATVDQNGLVRAVTKGTAVITVTTEEGGLTKRCTVTVTASGSPDDTAITNVAVSITAPAKDNAPATAAATDDTGYACGAVAWSPDDNPFLGGKVYTATITLMADEHYTFASTLITATINNQNATVTGNTGAALTLSLTFAATNTKTVTGISIKTPPDKLTYTHGEALDLSGLVVTLVHENDDHDTEEVALANFLSNNITTVPANGVMLSHIAHNGKPVAVKFGELTANTGNLTVNAMSLAIADAAHTKPYDDTTTATGVSVTLGGIVGDDDVSATTVTAVYTNANAGTKTVNITSVTLTGTAAGNYTVTLPANNITVAGGIAPKAIIVTPDAGQSKVYGGVDPVFSYTHSPALVADHTLTGALARVAGDNAGTYAFTPGTLAVNDGNSGNNYSLSLGGNNVFTINKANPSVTSWPVSTTITYGAALSTSALTGGAGSGVFAWKNGAIIPPVANSGYEVTFTPADATNYNTLTQNVNITVNKADPSVTWQQFRIQK